MIFISKSLPDWAWFLSSCPTGTNILKIHDLEEDWQSEGVSFSWIPESSPQVKESCSLKFLQAKNIWHVDGVILGELWPSVLHELPWLPENWRLRELECYEQFVCSQWLLGVKLLDFLLWISECSLKPFHLDLKALGMIEQNRFQ